MTNMARQSKADKALDSEINKLFHENCSNIVINIMDIPKVFAEAKKARAEGRDMKEAIVSFVSSIRKN
jgi:hypothetical protein